MGWTEGPQASLCPFTPSAFPTVSAENPTRQPIVPFFNLHFSGNCVMEFHQTHMRIFSLCLVYLLVMCTSLLNCPVVLFLRFTP